MKVESQLSSPFETNTTGTYPFPPASMARTVGAGGFPPTHNWALGLVAREAGGLPEPPSGPHKDNEGGSYLGCLCLALCEQGGPSALMFTPFLRVAPSNRTYRGGHICSLQIEANGHMGMLGT